MSRSSEGDDLTMKEVEEALEGIDLKFTKFAKKDQNFTDKSIILLLEGFDSLGLPEIKPCLPLKDIHEKIIVNAQLLIEMYRRNLSQLREDDFNFKSRDAQYANLHKQLLQRNDSCRKLEQKNRSQEAVIRKLNFDNKDMKEKIKIQKNEMQKMKQYYTSKQNELQHSIRKLEKNNQDLKDMFGQDVGKYLARDSVVADYVKKCKLNEEVYKDTIKKLQNKNEQLLQEIIRLRENC